MKKFILALAMLCGSVNATEYWTKPTEAGGRIVLTFTKTESCGSLFFMYIEKSTQEVDYGCWTVINERIHVRYDSGVRRIYTPDDWVKHDTEKK